MDILSSFSVQPLSLSLLHGPITFLLVSSHLFSFQRHEFICGTFEKPISWPFLQILWHSSYYLKFSVLLLSSLLLLFFLFLFFFFFFSFSFFCSYFSYFFPFFPFFSFSFCFCYPNFFYFSLYCLLYFSEHLVIFTSPALQSISGLWQASHNIPKITLYF